METVVKQLQVALALAGLNPQGLVTPDDIKWLC
jgi:hypothetical protein